jgi:hypothetical protein
MSVFSASRRLTRMTLVVLCGVFAFGAGAKMMAAQTTTSQPILVICTGQNSVPAKALNQLCESFHSALVAKYPDASFALIDGTPDPAAPTVTLEAFTANPTMIEARLNWQLHGETPVIGARMGFSISDSDITPAMRRKFLTRLVNDTPLPL